jgi:hypothetical protein
MDIFGHIGVSIEDEGIVVVNEETETGQGDFLSLVEENENFVPDNDDFDDDNSVGSNISIGNLADQEAIKKFSKFFKSNFKNMVVYK